MVYMRRFVFIIPLLCIIFLLGGIYTTWRLSDNYELDVNEMKAYFRATVSLDYKPDIEKIHEFIYEVSFQH